MRESSQCHLLASILDSAQGGFPESSALEGGMGHLDHMVLSPTKTVLPYHLSQATRSIKGGPEGEPEKVPYAWDLSSGASVRRLPCMP